MRVLPCPDTAIDLGRRTARLYVRGRGLMSPQPSIVATCPTTRRLMAVGEDARLMQRYSPAWARFSWPFEAGLPRDPEAAQQLLRQLIRDVHGSRRLAKPRMAVAVPSMLTDVQRHAVRETGYAAGARRLRLVPAPLAAARGAGLPVEELQAVAVAHIGAAQTDVAVITHGGIICAHTAPVGGDRLDESIIAHLRRRLGLLVSGQTAEKLKIEIGALNARGPQRDRRMLVYGRDLYSGLPKAVMLSSADIEAALIRPATAIVDAIRTLLAQCPPELAGDLAFGGMTLTGGGALLHGLAELIRDTNGLPARVAEDAGQAVVMGLAHYLEEIPLLPELQRTTRGPGLLARPVQV